MTLNPWEKALKTLEKIPAPSDFAKPNGRGSCMKIEGLPLKHHRGPGCSDMPVQFYHEIFQTFFTQLNEKQDEDDKEIREYRMLVKQLLPPMSMLIQHEANRSGIFLNFLHYLGLHLEPVVSPNGPDRMISDGTLYTSGSCQFLLCNLEVKSDFPSGCCTLIQTVAYYVKFVQRAILENSKFGTTKKTCFLAFLILLEGKNIMISYLQCD